MEPKPGDKVGEQFGGGGNAEGCGQEDEGGSCPSNLGREYLTDDYLESKRYMKHGGIFFIVLC